MLIWIVNVSLAYVISIIPDPKRLESRGILTHWGQGRIMDLKSGVAQMENFQEKQGRGGVGGGVKFKYDYYDYYNIYISNTIDIFKLFYYNIVYLKPPYTIL